MSTIERIDDVISIVPNIKPSAIELRGYIDELKSQGYTGEFLDKLYNKKDNDK